MSFPYHPVRFLAQLARRLCLLSQGINELS